MHGIALKPYYIWADAVYIYIFLKEDFPEWLLSIPIHLNPRFFDMNPVYNLLHQDKKNRLRSICPVCK